MCFIYVVLSLLSSTSDFQLYCLGCPLPWFLSGSRPVPCPDATIGLGLPFRPVGLWLASHMAAVRLPGTGMLFPLGGLVFGLPLLFWVKAKSLLFPAKAVVNLHVGSRMEGCKTLPYSVFCSEWLFSKRCLSFVDNMGILQCLSLQQFLEFNG